MACLVLPPAAHAQDDRALADSLIALLPHLPADPEKVYVYRDIAYYLRAIDPDGAMDHARRGERMALGLGSAEGRIDNLYQQAFVWEERDEHDSARAVFKRCLRLARHVRDGSREAKTLLSLGTSFYFQGLLSEAIAYYDSALTVYGTIDEPAAEAYALNNLAVIYRMRRDHPRAIAMYQRSLELKRAQGDVQGAANSLYNLGLAHAYSGDAEQALPYFAEARAHYQPLGDSLQLALTDVAEGVALHALGRMAEAVPLLERGLELPDRHVVERASVRLHLGELDLASGLHERGMQRLLEAHAIAAPSGRLDLLRQIEKALAQAYDGLGDPARAAPHWRAYAQLGDTLANEQRQWAMEEMQARYESREKDLTIQVQEKALAQEATRRRLNFAIVLLLGALLITAAVYARSRVRLNLRLRRALEEREWLLREMHHRVKNNLQMLNSLLSIQSRTLADPNARAAMQDSRARVQAIGLIHQFLYGRDAFRQIHMRAYLERLLEQIAQAADLDHQRIRLHTEVDDLQLDVDLATPIGLIVNELVTNAVKHAFPEGRRRTVRVTLPGSEHALDLAVQDDGVGGAEGAPDIGFGHTLLRTLTQRLRASMHSENGPGTHIRFTIPRYAHEQGTVHPGGGG